MNRLLRPPVVTLQGHQEAHMEGISHRLGPSISSSGRKTRENRLLSLVGCVATASGSDSFPFNFPIPPSSLGERQPQKGVSSQMKSTAQTRPSRMLCPWETNLEQEHFVTPRTGSSKTFITPALLIPALRKKKKCFFVMELNILADVDLE